MSKFHRVNENFWVFECPGCGDNHSVKTPIWTFNGDLEKPTVQPSILYRTGHYVSGHGTESCWCSYNEEHRDDPAPFTCKICHSFVTDGKIQFLSDCTHDLAGKTVDLIDWDSPENTSKNYV